MKQILKKNEFTAKKIKPLPSEKRKKVSQWGHPCYMRTPFLENRLNSITTIVTQ